MTTASASTVLCLISVFALLRISNAHSYLLNPKGDRTPTWTATCRVGGPPHDPDDNCPGPCIDTSGDWWKDASGAPRILRRGATLPLIWARNGHTGGFIRFSLVPKNKRMDKKAHDMMTFRYACYDSGMHKCKEDRCGTDRDGYAYQAAVEIPTTHPDGEYILGFAWYGGTINNDYGFGDYYSCSNVIIRGGPMTATYEAQWSPGEGLGGKTTCSSSTSKLGECPREPCPKHIESERVPSQFKNNSKPNPILSSWFTVRSSRGNAGGRLGRRRGRRNRGRKGRRPRRA